MWTIGIVSTSTQLVKPPPYLFSDTAVALLYLAPMIGTVLAEFFGHWFNDFLCNRYMRSHGGAHQPENRLWGVYPSWLMGIGGLVLFGQAFGKHLPWIAIAFGWGMQCFGESWFSLSLCRHEHMADGRQSQRPSVPLWLSRPTSSTSSRSTPHWLLHGSAPSAPSVSLG